MNVLVINSGSSSLKFQLIDSATETVLAKGLCERIGIDGTVIYQKDRHEKQIFEHQMPTHADAIKFVQSILTDEENGVIRHLDEINAVGHRVAHGGEKFSTATVITDDVLHEIEKCTGLAPLHNPVNIIGIRECLAVLPNVPMVAVFDTAFHQTMPKKAYLYGIPNKYYDEYKVRRYGFHGTSHKFVYDETVKILNQNDAKVIVCHLGNGSSICAINSGKSVDNSMGFTPLEGLVMGTRSGDIDPGIISFIAEKEKLGLPELMAILNEQSGVKGISDKSSDFRDLEEAAAAGDEWSKLALDIFAYRVAKYIGSYAAAMNGVDAIVFTAGIGENAINVRKNICGYLTFLGVRLDDGANNSRGEQKKISSSNSSVKVFVIPTNEELTIARETAMLV